MRANGLRRNAPGLRRGAAAFAVVAIIGLTTASSLLALNQVQTNLFIVNSGVRHAQAQQLANGCAGGVLKVLPGLFQSTLQTMEESSAADWDASFATLNPEQTWNRADRWREVYSTQFDDQFFGDSPLGTAPLETFCVARILSVQESPPPLGFSTETACFKRVTVEIDGVIFQTRSPGGVPTEEVQREAASQSSVILQAAIGPLACQ